jgi:DNA polymerase II small subunit
MRDRIVHTIASAGALAEPPAVDAIESASDPAAALAAVVDRLRAGPDAPDTVTEAWVHATLSGEAPQGARARASTTARGATPRASTRRPAADVDGQVRVVKDPTGESLCEGKLDDFTQYFRDRLARLRRLLRQRREASGAQEVARLKPRAGGVRTIGMVGEVRRTPNGRLHFELEDETGSIHCVAGKDAPTDLVNDEVVLVVGSLSSGSDPALFADEVVRPDVLGGRPLARASADVSAAFISDVHVGSRTFLEDRWLRFIEWLSDKGGHSDEVASRVKYLVISGDLVDGVGVFPDQERALSVSDLEEQYTILAGYLKMLPDHIQVILLPGNHDGVRPAEPQPALPERTRRAFDSNVRFVGNPCDFDLHGVRVTAYHGRSFDDLVTNISGMSYRRPLDMMETLLAKRHLAPIYGDKTPLAPERRDWLVMDEVPDIFVTGHVHLTGARAYQSVTLVHDSAWQDQTDYQRMMNLVPDPARVPVVNLASRAVNIVDFWGA